MKLAFPRDLRDRRAGLLCRQSRIAGLAAIAVFLGIPVAFSWAILAGELTTWAWWAVGGYCLLFKSFMTTWFLGMFHSSNWLVEIRPEELRINIRSFANRSFEAAETIIRLDYDEIESVRRYSTSYAIPGHRSGDSSGQRQWSVESLEIILQHNDTGQLRDALTDERQRVTVSYFLWTIRCTSKTKHYPVSLPSDRIIRVDWRGKSNHIVPSLDKVLDAMRRQSVLVLDDASSDRVDWEFMSAHDFDTALLELVQSGNTIDAAKVLTRYRGYSLTEAKRFVDELIGG